MALKIIEPLKRCSCRRCDGNCPSNISHRDPGGVCWSCRRNCGVTSIREAKRRGVFRRGR